MGEYLKLQYEKIYNPCRHEHEVIAAGAVFCSRCGIWLRDLPEPEETEERR